MTIGFRSNSVVNSKKMITICFKSVNFFVMCASLVKAKILQKHQFWRIFYFRSVNFFDMCASLVKEKFLQKSHFLKDIFNFLAKLSFSKMLVSSGYILVFWKRYLLFLKSVNFSWRCFLLEKNINLCKKR